MVSYKKMSLFDVPKGSYIVHACNSQGVWGSGIAVDFKRLYPHAFAVYHRACQGNSSFALGKSWSIWDETHHIVCLIVSQGYGKTKSAEADILAHTKTALTSHLDYVTNHDKECKVIYSNRFNSGFFAVPWPKTEAVLKEVLKNYDIKWVVCDPNLGDTAI